MISTIRMHLNGIASITCACSLGISIATLSPWGIFFFSIFTALNFLFHCANFSILIKNSWKMALVLLGTSAICAVIVYTDGRVPIVVDLILGTTMGWLFGDFTIEASCKM